MTVAVGFVVGIEDPGRDDVRRLLQTHRDWSHRQTPREYSHALSADRLSDRRMTLFAARSPAGDLLGMVALKELGPGHGEVKSMHTAESARGRGVGRALLNRLLHEARSRGYARVSLETGTTEAFVAARELYATAGFRPGDGFGHYTNTAHNLCMHLDLNPADRLVPSTAH